MSTAYVYTPKGSRVEVIANRTWADTIYTYEQALEIERTFLGMYPNITKISGPNPAYNCHSYAWYSNEPSTNKYWLNKPHVLAYMTDGSYKKCPQLPLPTKHIGQKATILVL